MKTKHDEPNVLMALMTVQLNRLASMGATNKELNRIWKKGGDATLLDIAEVECRHTRYEEDE